MPCSRRPLRRVPVHVAVCAGILQIAFPPVSRAAFTESAALFGIAAGDSMSYGASFPDVDGDGDPDFYANLHWAGPGELWRNDGSGFVRILPTPFTGEPDRHDIVWGDFDGNGSPDAYVCHGGDQNNEQLWNMGAGLWAQTALVSGTADYSGRGREIALLDVDGDNRLDIYVANDSRPGFVKPSVLFYNNGDGTFARFPNTELVYQARLHVASADYDADGDPDLVVTNAPYAPGEVYRNEGGIHFVDVTSSVFPGITDPLKQANGLTWADYDNDGDPDLLACGGNRSMWDFAAVEGDSIRFYAETVSAQTKTFHVKTDGDSVTIWAVKSDYQPLWLWYGAQQDSTATFPVTLAIASCQGTPAKLTGGNRRGLFLAATTVAGGDSLRLSVGGAAAGADLLVGGSLRTNGTESGFGKDTYAARPGFSLGNFTNRLYRNEGNGTFAEVTSTAFPAASNASGISTLGAAWGDYDNDGWQDVHFANPGDIEIGNVADVLLRNRGDGTFEDVTALEGVAGSTRGLTDGSAWADVNADGFLDLFVANGAEHPPFGVGPRELYVNAGDNGNHWVELQLRGLVSNGAGIGAKVRVVTPSGDQFQWRLGDSENCFSGQQILHFGLGAETVVDSLQVFWPAGSVDTFEDVAADARYWAVEGEALRPTGTPDFLAVPDSVSAYLDEGETKVWPVALGNPGGQVSVYAASVEACDGSPVGWLAADPDSAGVWPGGGRITVTADASGLTAGEYCARVVFSTDGASGNDTLVVALVVTQSAVDAPVAAGIPDTFSLGAPRPNPGRGPVDVVLALPRDDRVEADVVAVDGRRVAKLVDGALPAGRHVLTWDLHDDSGGRAASGVYFLRVLAGSGQGIRKVIRID